MFNIFKKKSDDKVGESYSISKMTQDGKSYILRFNKNLWKIAGSAEYPFNVGIATKLKTENNGFPTTEENAELFKVEDAIIVEFQKENTAIFAGTITGGGIKEFVLYTGNPKKVEEKFKQIKNTITDYELQLNIQEDKNWEIFKTYCPK